LAVRSFSAAPDTITGQARLLGLAIAARPRVIVLDPLDYSALLPYLRAAHDAEVPVVLVETPRDVANPAFVATFVSPDQDSLDAQTSAEVVRLLRGAVTHRVAFISAHPPPRTAAASAIGLSRDLASVMPDAALTELTVEADDARGAQGQLQTFIRSHPDVSVIVAGDAIAAQSLVVPLTAAGSHRPAVIVTSLGAAGGELLSLSLAQAVIGADVCSLVQSAMSAAVEVSANNAPAVPRSVGVAVRTFTPNTGRAADGGAAIAC